MRTWTSRVLKSILGTPADVISADKYHRLWLVTFSALLLFLSTATGLRWFEISTWVLYGLTFIGFVRCPLEPGLSELQIQARRVIEAERERSR